MKYGFKDLMAFASFILALLTFSIIHTGVTVPIMQIRTQF
ncbi:hypothetical protein LAD12857_08370 [Lacrimispora amygdalina]|uniref:Uncharacterized protein n=1 Tax=Lacrimispora amygdalina TaxID=253257 RepID=A0ABQ5M1U1_9FIRM